MSYFLKKLNYIKKLLQVRLEQGAERNETRISASLSENLAEIRRRFASDVDVHMHEFTMSFQGARQGCAIYIDGLADPHILGANILRPLLQSAPKQNDPSAKKNIVDYLMECVFSAGLVEKETDLDALIDGCLCGDTVVLLDGETCGILVNTKGWAKRGVEEPQTEAVVRGPREGFTESLRVNTALLRRRVKTTNLRMEQLIVGRQSKTKICIAYVEGIARPSIVNTIRKRIESLEVDCILDSSFIEQYIEDAPFSIFPTINNTEKPDVAASRVLEGRVCILVDGSPFALTAPMLFIETLQTSEDYYSRPLYASCIRLLRYIAFFISAFGPAIYIALTTFHQELIPTTLLLTIASAREGTPFPVYFEAFIMVFSFEILREAGVRLPRPVGQAVSIVGALVMGEAAVSAGIVGAPMVIVVAITAVSSFIIPILNDTGSILRLIAMLLASIWGGFGIALCFLGMLIHLACLKSFGVPYYEGLTPSHDLQDSYIRLPLRNMIFRPKDIASQNVRRRGRAVPLFRPYEAAPSELKGEDDE